MVADSGGELNQQVRRYDPQRKQRIIAACREVIIDQGVRGTTHRKVAAAADVPLGSMSYHFTGMTELLRDTFEQHTTEISEDFAGKFAQVTSQTQALDLLVEVVDSGFAFDPEQLVLNLELYTLASREPEFKEITSAWLSRTREVLEQFFDPEVARALDATLGGLSIYRALGLGAVSDQDIATLLRSIAHPAGV